MQIGHLNHIQFPGVGNQPAPSNATTDASDAATGTTSNGRGAAVRQVTPAQNAPGVVAKIQSGSDGTSGVALPPGLVYSMARKASAEDADSDADTGRMAEKHQQAMERASGANAQLAVDKDGVLVAKPAATDESKSQSFVLFAVNTMREYADEQARLKAQDQPADTGATHIIPRNLGDVQKLAARFKLFA